MRIGTSRRAFLGMATAAACSGLPHALFAATSKRDESLIAVLSDCHVGNWKSTDYQAINFAACIAKIMKLNPLPAKMFILGDLAYLWGRKEDYELARKLLKPVYDAGIEVTIGMGNHDRRENFLEYWPEYAGRSPVAGKIVSKIRGRYFDYIMLDTLDQPEATDKWITPGVLDDIQREWLRAECAAAARPLIVMAHHPPTELGDPGKGRSLASARKFGEIIMGPAQAPTRCCGYLYGHEHFWSAAGLLQRWTSGRVGMTACLPSTGHWGDIGYALLREQPDRAVLSLVQYDYFSPSPLPAGAKPNPAWQAIVKDHEGARCTFVAPQV